MAKTARGQGMKTGTHVAMYVIRRYLLDHSNEPATFADLSQAVQAAGFSYSDAYNALQNLKKHDELIRAGGVHNNDVTYILANKVLV